MGSIFVFSSLIKCFGFTKWYWISSGGSWSFQSHQLGNAQWTDNSPVYPQLVRLPSAWSPDRTVCVQVVPPPRAPLSLSAVQRRCRRQLQLRPRKFRIAAAVARVVAMLRILRPSSLWSMQCLEMSARNLVLKLLWQTFVVTCVFESFITNRHEVVLSDQNKRIWILNMCVTQIMWIMNTPFRLQFLMHS